MEILIAIVVVGIFVYGVYDFIKGYIKNKSDTKDFDVLIKSANNLGFKNKFIESGSLEALFELEYKINPEIERNIVLKIFRNSAYINYIINQQLNYKSKQINIYKPYQQILELSLQEAKNDIIENYKNS
jgi:hypothetical protein